MFGPRKAFWCYNWISLSAVIIFCLRCPLSPLAAPFHQWLCLLSVLLIHFSGLWSPLWEVFSFVCRERLRAALRWASQTVLMVLWSQLLDLGAVTPPGRDSVPQGTWKNPLSYPKEDLTGLDSFPALSLSYRDRISPRIFILTGATLLPGVHPLWDTLSWGFEDIWPCSCVCDLLLFSLRTPLNLATSFSIQPCRA